MLRIARGLKGGSAPLQLATHNELLVSTAGMGTWHEAALAGKSFFACTQAGVATTVGLGTTVTGIILTNPNGSNKLIIVQKLLGALTVDPGGAAPVGLAVMFSNPTEVTHSAALTPHDSLIGDGHNTAVALVDSSATLPQAPVFARAIPGSTVATGAKEPFGISENIDGAIILSQGTAVATVSLTTAVTAIWSIMWTETDLS